MHRLLVRHIDVAKRHPRQKSYSVEVVVVAAAVVAVVVAAVVDGVHPMHLYR